MKSILFLTLSFLALPCVSSEADNLIFKRFADSYVDAVETKNDSEISRLTSSENIKIHTVNIRTLTEVNGAPFSLNVSPHENNKNDMAALIISMSEGKCGFAAEPTHKVELIWHINIEEFTVGHACHRQTSKSSSITLFVRADNNQVKEVTTCSNDYKVSTSETIKFSDLAIKDNEKTEIKAWLNSQPYFSRISSLKHIRANYGLSFQQANVAVKALCKELQPNK